MTEVSEEILKDIVSDCTDACLSVVRRYMWRVPYERVAKSIVLQMLVGDFHYRVEEVAPILGNANYYKTMSLLYVKRKEDNMYIYNECVKEYKKQMRKTVVLTLPASLSAICSICKQPSAIPFEGSPVSACCSAALVLTRKEKILKHD